MIEFKSEHADYQGNVTTEITYKILNDPTIDEIMREFRYFLLALSYSPESIDRYIEAE